MTLPDNEIDRFFEVLFKHSIDHWPETCKAKGVEDKSPVIKKYWDEIKCGRWKKQWRPG